MTAKPLKRNKNIQILSREHHHGLLFCWKIKAGLNKAVDPKRIIAYINFFWDSHLRMHFKEEEDLLFLKSEDSMCREALIQHEEIRESHTRPFNDNYHDEFWKN